MQYWGNLLGKQFQARLLRVSLLTCIRTDAVKSIIIRGEKGWCLYLMSAHLWTNCWWITHCLAFSEAVLVLGTAGLWTTGNKSQSLQNRKPPTSLAPFVGDSLTSSPCFGEMLLAWTSHQTMKKQLPCVPLLTRAPKYPQMCMYAHSPQILTGEKTNRWNSSCLVSFLNVCQHYGLCPASVLCMAFSGELLEWLSIGHAFGNSHTCKRLSWKMRRINNMLVARTVSGLDGYFFFGKFNISNK